MLCCILRNSYSGKKPLALYLPVHLQTIIGLCFLPQDKLKQLYITWRREKEIIHRFSQYATLLLADLRSICPSTLLDEDPNQKMTWLTDNVSLVMLLCSLCMPLHTINLIFRQKYAHILVS